MFRHIVCSLSLSVSPSRRISRLCPDDRKSVRLSTVCVCMHVRVWYLFCSIFLDHVHKLMYECGIYIDLSAYIIVRSLFCSHDDLLLLVLLFFFLHRSFDAIYFLFRLVHIVSP